ncbi:MAG: ExbD/TolR family protein [Chitinophagaceae bacterium]
MRIDMTPMVDLGFLLITFFIYTTTMAEHKSTTLFMPADGSATTVGESNAITIILHNNAVYYYTGKWDDTMKNNQVHKTTFNVYNGIGKLIREKQKTLGTKRNNLVLLIKASDEATYNDVIMHWMR